MTVVDLEILKRFPYAAGREFKNIGSFEQVDAEVTLSVDPDGFTAVTIQNTGRF